MTEKKKIVLFVAVAYAFFWGLLIILVALIMSETLSSEGVPMDIAIVLGSWTPTIALLILFKKLYPNSSIKHFYINAFKKRINWKLLIFVAILQVFIFICTAGIVSLMKNVSLFNILDLSLKTIGMGFFWTLIQGATGEESGWRGFLQPALEKKHSVIKSSAIVGVIWGLWHLPLWLFSGYTGIDLLRYSCLFLLWIIAGTIIINICHNHCKNLFVPIWIHFMFNFCMTVFAGDERDTLNALTFITGFYILAAVGYIVWHKRNSKKSMSTK